MITDAVLGLLVEVVGGIGGMLPSIPLGPLAPGSALWTSLGDLATRMGWLTSILPWTAIGVGAAFLLTCSIAALGLYLLRLVLRVLKLL